MDAGHSYICIDTQENLIQDAVDMITEQNAVIMNGEIPGWRRCDSCDVLFEQHRNEKLCTECWDEAHMVL
jgi:hypothetical protein